MGGPAAAAAGALPREDVEPLVVFEEKVAVDPSDAGTTRAPGSVLTRASSTPLLTARSTSSRRGGTPLRSPFRVAPPFQQPLRDKRGYAKFHVYRPAHTQEWDDKFHLEFTGKGDRRAENELVQKSLRKYFSAPHSEAELKEHLSSTPSGASVLRSLELPEASSRRPTSPITPDTSPTNMPERHALGGSMRDRDRRPRKWNDRWPMGIHIMNDQLHASHRQYFVEKSIFEKAPSQRWRRFLDQEEAPGVWVSAESKKPQRYGPLGV